MYISFSFILLNKIHSQIIVNSFLIIMWSNIYLFMKKISFQFNLTYIFICNIEFLLFSNFKIERSVHWISNSFSISLQMWFVQYFMICWINIYYDTYFFKDFLFSQSFLNELNERYIKYILVILKCIFDHRNLKYFWVI